MPEMDAAPTLLSLELLSDLIGRIYDCALDPERWPEVLADINRRLDFLQATLTLQAMPSRAVLLSVASGISDDWLTRSTRHMVLRLSRGGAAWPASAPCPWRSRHCSAR